MHLNTGLINIKKHLEQLIPKIQILYQRAKQKRVEEQEFGQLCSQYLTELQQDLFFLVAHLKIMKEMTISFPDSVITDLRGKLISLENKFSLGFRRLNEGITVKKPYLTSEKIEILDELTKRFITPSIREFEGFIRQLGEAMQHYEEQLTKLQAQVDAGSYEPKGAPHPDDAMHPKDPEIRVIHLKDSLAGIKKLHDEIETLLTGSP